MKYLLTLVLLCVIGLPACYQDDSNKYTSNMSGLVFTKTEVSNGILFQWDQSFLSNFTEYVVTKHDVSTDVVKSLSDLNKLNSENVVARVKSRHITSTKDSVSTSSTYYRLYLVFGGKFVASDEVFQSSNYYMLDIQFFNQLLIDRRKGNLYLFRTNLVEIVDLKRMEQKDLITTTRTVSLYSMSLGYDQDGNTEIYSSNGEKILVFDGENLQIKDTIYNIPRGKLIYSTATDEHSNIFFTEADSVSKYDPLTRKISKFGSNGTFQEAIQVTRDGKTIIAGTGFTYMFQYRIDQNDKILSIKKSPSVIDFSNRNFKLANAEPTIVAGNSGSIYAEDFILQKHLGNEVEGYVGSVFDDNDKFIYSIGGINNFIFRFENKAGYKFIDRIFVRNNASHIFVYEGNIFTIGNFVDPTTGFNSLLLERVYI